MVVVQYQWAVYHLNNQFPANIKQSSFFPNFDAAVCMAKSRYFCSKLFHFYISANFDNKFFSRKQK